ncbi:MAG: metalloendopeptidase [Sphingomonadaceae bacterium]|nr:metalloendopeptidase [Sphingomonadaceae bacterium]
MRCRFAVIAAFAVAGLLGLPAIAQAPSQFDSADEARAALDAARQQQRNARARSERLEREAASSRETSAKARADAAALAARVQQAEASIAAAEARLALTDRERRLLDRRLSARRAPLVRLTGALQSMSRRPLALSALQSGSLRDLVYTRAVLDSTIPVIRNRTAALRGDLDRAKSLQAEARQAVADRRDSEAALIQRRKQLTALAESERLKARRAAGGADREAQRALVLAEQAIDLDQLVGRLEVAGSLRTRLAALPGPLPRPADPRMARVSSAPSPRPSAMEPPTQYQLPVAGKIAAGFGEAAASGQRQAGIVLSARPRALIVAPGAGRIAFAGPYRGFGRIVIVEHANGWISLVTGLGTLDVDVGQNVGAGSPLGLAPAAPGEVTLELRQDGEPVNPLDHLR